MLKVWGRLSLAAAILGASMLAAPQTPSPAAPLQDRAARAEIRSLRAKLDSVAQEFKSKPASTDTGATERIAKDLDLLLARPAERASGWTWGMPLVSLALIAAISYWWGTQKARALPPSPVDAESPPGPATWREGPSPSTLSQIRAKLIELERDVRMYAGIYSLLLDQQALRNGSLQRIAEISTREQEALLRYRSAAGELLALGYDFGAIEPLSIEGEQVADLGDWIARWWQALDETLIRDGESTEHSSKREELFRTARTTMKALAEGVQELSASGAASLM